MDVPVVDNTLVPRFVCGSTDLFAKPSPLESAAKEALKDLEEGRYTRYFSAKDLMYGLQIDPEDMGLFEEEIDDDGWDDPDQD